MSPGWAEFDKIRQFQVIWGPPWRDCTSPTPHKKSSYAITCIS